MKSIFSLISSTNHLHCSQTQGAFCAALVQGPPGGSAHHACVCWPYTRVGATIGPVQLSEEKMHLEIQQKYIRVVTFCDQLSSAREGFVRPKSCVLKQRPQHSWSPGDPPNCHLPSNHQPDLRCYFSIINHFG